MSDNIYVIFSQRAFNAIVTETIDKHPIETGGILIGYVLDNGVWIVVENIPPGYKTSHQWAYFEYDAEFVNYLSNVIAKQYKGNLQVLGLWHRHPSSMDVFSTTDDETNLKFAKEKSCGAISALVNCDPQMRMTMYHVSTTGHYNKMEWFVDDGQTIPEDYLALHYISERDLPSFDERGINTAVSDCQENTEIGLDRCDEVEQIDIEPGTTESIEKYTISKAIDDICLIIKKLFANHV